MLPFTLIEYQCQIDQKSGYGWTKKELRKNFVSHNPFLSFLIHEHITVMLTLIINFLLSSELIFPSGQSNEKIRVPYVYLNVRSFIVIVC